MRFKKTFLTLGTTTLIALPFVTIACSRYSVENHNEIVQVLKTYAHNNKYLTKGTLPPDEIKIPSLTETLKMKYDVAYMAGAINWSTKIGDTIYKDTLGGWKQYPTIDVPNPNTNDKKWGDQGDTIIGVVPQLQLQLLGNGYIVAQNINLDGIKEKPKNDIDTLLITLFQKILNNKIVNEWVNPDSKITKPSKVQFDAIDAAKPTLPPTPTINEWFSKYNINNVSGMFSITNKNIPGVNSALLNYTKLLAFSNIQAKKDFLITWANKDKEHFKDMFGNFKNYSFNDFLNVIKNIK